MGAREKAVAYLGRFSRTERQVRNYLLRKEFTADEVEDAIAYLNKHNFLNDYSFAESLIQSKIRHGDGPIKIKQMLYQKGIDINMAGRLLRELYPQQIQIERAADLFRERFRRTQDREKLLRFVASRGFPRYVMIQAFEIMRNKKR